MFLKGLMDDLWSLYFSVQLICYLTVYKLQIPGNAELFLIQLKNLIEFNALKADTVVQIIYGE